MRAESFNSVKRVASKQALRAEKRQTVLDDGRRQRLLSAIAALDAGATHCRCQRGSQSASWNFSSSALQSLVTPRLPGHAHHLFEDQKLPRHQQKVIDVVSAAVEQFSEKWSDLAHLRRCSS